MINPEQPDAPLAAEPDITALANSGISIGRYGLEVRAGRHLHLSMSLQLLFSLITISSGAGIGSLVTFLRG